MVFKRTPPYFKLVSEAPYDEDEAYDTLGIAIAVLLNVTIIADRIIAHATGSELYLAFVQDFNVLFESKFDGETPAEDGKAGRS